MAILRLEDGTTITKGEEIAERLAALNVQLKTWSTGDNPRIHELLAQPSLSEEEKEEVLGALDHYFEELQRDLGYQSRDLIVLHPGIPNLDTLLAKFESCHTHADDEVRYIIDGEGVFGFVCPNGKQIELTVQAQEYINVPANSEHWFHLTESKRVKAVRYFSNMEGWTPLYTGTPIRFQEPVLS